MREEKMRMEEEEHERLQLDLLNALEEKKGANLKQGSRSVCPSQSTSTGGRRTSTENRARGSRKRSEACNGAIQKARILGLCPWKSNALWLVVAERTPTLLLIRVASFLTELLE